MAFIEKRIAKDGTVSYRAQVRLKGYPSQTATFDRKTDAKQWAADTESALRQGRLFKTAKKHLVSDLIDSYIKHVIPNKGSQASHQQTQLLWWRDAIGAYAIDAVTPTLLAECRDTLLKGATSRGDSRSPATVRRYIAALSHAFTYAVRVLEWLDNNPVKRLEKPSEPKGRVRFLSDDERERLFTACRNSRGEFLYLYVLMAISTGMRQSEILNLYWSMPGTPPDGGAWGVVMMKERRVVLHQTKNNERRVIPLPATVAAELESIKRDEGLVFPSATDPDKPMSMRTAFENALKAAQIDDFRFHDLRHSCASYLAMSGASLAEIAEILGHKTLQMVKRYSHFSDSHVAGVLERMNAKILP